MEFCEVMDAARKASEYAPLVLAYLGDALYDVYVRERALSEHPFMQAGKLHNHVSRIVCAHAQSNSIMAMMPMLTDKESDQFMRGRNSKPHTMAKNASVMDYKRATGFEAVLGYIHMSGDKERLELLMKTAYENAFAEKESSVN